MAGDDATPGSPEQTRRAMAFVAGYNAGVDYVSSAKPPNPDAFGHDDLHEWLMARFDAFERENFGIPSDVDVRRGGDGDAE